MLAAYYKTIFTLNIFKLYGTDKTNVFHALIYYYKHNKRVNLMLSEKRASLALKRRKAIRQFAQGKGYKYVSKKLEVNVWTVREWMRAYKAGNYKPGAKKFWDFSKEERALRRKSMIELSQKGLLSIRQIAEMNCCSEKTVRRVINEYKATLLEESQSSQSIA